jgi:hypothetical protein
MDPSTFEKVRLELFEQHGFIGSRERLADRDGRETYLIRHGDGPCPTILIHGGLSELSEWFPLAARLPEPLIMADRPGCRVFAAPHRSRRPRRCPATGQHQCSGRPLPV